MTKIPVPMLGKNIRKARKEKGLSLEKLADLTGVSKAMLSQIEGEKTNPTVATVWKIAKGLEIPFHTILEEDSQQKFQVIRAEDVFVLSDPDGACTFNIVSTYDDERLELYAVELKGEHKSEPHIAGSKEVVYVVDGRIEIRAGKNSATLGPGDCIHYGADCKHAMKNLTDKPARLFLTVELA